jgi:transcription initiation factor TFIID TATA-box-binding protein
MKIVNIVATVILDEPLDLNRVHKHLPSSKFPKGGSPWLQYRLQPENYYTTFYKSGKFLITGVTSPEVIRHIADRIIQILKKNDIDVEITEIRIHNFVVVDTVGHEVQFDKIISSLQNVNIEYEPEQFPGMIIKMGGHSFLLFSSGKIILTGVRDIESITPALISFKEKIESISY